MCFGDKYDGFSDEGIYIYCMVEMIVSTVIVSNNSLVLYSQ